MSLQKLGCQADTGIPIMFPLKYDSNIYIKLPFRIEFHSISVANVRRFWKSTTLTLARLLFTAILSCTSIL